MTALALDPSQNGASEVSDAEILATVVEGDFRLQLELPEDLRLRLADAGAGALADRYHARVREKAGALSQIVRQQAEQAEALRERILTWLHELNTDDDPPEGTKK